MAKKRRQRGEGSLYRRADGQWVGRVELGWVNGKRRQKWVYARTQREAVRKLADAKRAHDAGDENTANLTTGQWLTEWVDKIAPRQVKPRTLATYRSYVHGYLIPSLGRVRLDRLTPTHVRALHDYVQQGRSSTTAGHAHRVLSKALTDAMREGRVTRNVAKLEKAPANAPSTARALTLPEVAALLTVVDGTWDASRWHAALLLGARQGECLGLRWSSVNLEQGLVDLAWQLQRIPYRHGCDDPAGHRPDRCPSRELDVQPSFEHVVLDGNLCLQRPKTKGSVRVMVLPPPLVASLRQRWDDYQAERGGYPVDHGLVWARPDGRPIDGRRDYKAWHAALDAAGIERMPLHAARHTTATVLSALGVPEHVVMSILGHSEALTTRRYTHVDLTQQRAAMGQLGDALLLAE